MIIYIIILSFICKFIDLTFGMGYGTILTPVLLLTGFEPLQIVPAILFSEFVSGVIVAFFHFKLGNLEFSKKSKDVKVLIVLVACGIIGVSIGAILMVQLPINTLKFLMGIIVVLIGVCALSISNNKTSFNWMKIATLGTIASFNKTIVGGGYGPLIMGGQLLSGMVVKKAVSITSISKSMVCLFGLIAFFLLKQIDMSLTPWLMTGAVISAPFAAYMLKRLPEKVGKDIVLVMIIAMGCLIIYKSII